MMASSKSGRRNIVLRHRILRLVQCFMAEHAGAEEV
jgi:hypothetical protein